MKCFVLETFHTCICYFTLKTEFTTFKFFHLCIVFFTFASRFNILRAEVLNDISVCRRLTTTTIDSRTKIH